jgi:hypothetical protein
MGNIIGRVKKMGNKFTVVSFFFVDPGQPILPVTRSLDRVDHRVGFQNYAFISQPSSWMHHYI